MESNYSPTAEGILDAVTRIFAEKGYDGVRVTELAQAAQVNKATLYYQIGDKETLYRRVLERLLKRAADEVAEAVAAAGSCEEKVRCFIGILARNAGNLRFTAPIMLREVASGGSNLPDAALLQMSRLLGVLGEALDEGVAAGELRQVNSFLVHMMIVGTLILYSANEPIRRRVVKLNPSLAQEDLFMSSAELAEQMADLVLSGIRI
ncbi:MAG: TetR/AcrR family transcriptional regulator [Gammaproteobacteria bacterium]|nr:TetR/AcrR family transcriptional regulator [Gammaproteobacteria bacterium]MCB1880341.1 TetR/AcrR family transcriptional regulator [Gammaproteobacteria bacterium]